MDDDIAGDDDDGDDDDDDDDCDDDCGDDGVLQYTHSCFVWQVIVQAARCAH